MSARAVLFAHIHQTSFNVETIGRSGPFLKGCLRWVKLRKAQCEQMSSALHPIVDIQRSASPMVRDQFRANVIASL
jgi:hypothetical protein